MSKITKLKKAKKREERLLEMRRIHGEDYGKVQCPSCNKMVETDKIITGPDPFASEIYNDNRIVAQCVDCNYESCMDI